MAWGGGGTVSGLGVAFFKTRTGVNDKRLEVAAKFS